MYKIDITKNELIELDETTFSESNLKERDHIEEWLRKNPSIVEPDLLIIAHEYDRFESNERLDLLAVDKEGALVIIELKQDHSGTLVDFQALKYCSYCSTFKPQEIMEIYESYIKKFNLGINAVDSLLEFLELDSVEQLNNILNNAQRIIIIGKEIDKRILSVAAWLSQNDIDIKCFYIKPYTDDSSNSTYIDIEQIIPPPKIDDYFIKKKEVKSKGRLSQPAEIIQFFESIVNDAKSKGHHAYYSDGKSYCNIRSGIDSNLSFALKIVKRISSFAIEATAKNSTVKKILFDIFNKNQADIEKRTGLKFDIEAEGSRNTDWGRVITFIKYDQSLPLDTRVSDLSNKFTTSASVFKELLKDKF